MQSIQSKLQKDLYEFDVRLLNQRPNGSADQPPSIAGLQSLVREQQAHLSRYGVPTFDNAGRSGDDHDALAVERQRRMVKLLCWMVDGLAADSPEIH